jgi:hypothetical protein
MPAKKSGQNQPHANKEERPADNHNERRIAREIAALSHSISEEERTSRDAQERQDNGKKFREYLTLLFIILTTIGVFIQAFVFKGQLHEMEKAYGPIEKSAIAAKEAADAARDAVKQSEKTAERQLRAYISSVTINEGTQRSVPDGKLIARNFRVQWKNAGQTPAYVVESYTVPEFFGPDPGPLVLSNPKKKASAGFRPTVGPGITFSGPLQTIRLEDLVPVYERKKRLAFLAYVKYVDIFHDDLIRYEELRVEVQILSDPLIERLSNVFDWLALGSAETTESK